MSTYEFIAPCHFGTEAVLKRELRDLDLDIVKVQDGKVTFMGDEGAIALSNIFLRTAERVLIKVGEFKAESFDELFEKTKALPWERYIEKDGKFWVTKANSVNSKIFSPRDIQSIMKKAMVERLKAKYHISWFKEEGSAYAVRVSINKDIVTVGLDTTGVSLHKRGYRREEVLAPVSETLAAAIILLSPWKGERILIDPFCGSGTFPIEAALMASNIAPGLNRTFAAQDFHNLISKSVWDDAFSMAKDKEDRNVETKIQGFDIDERAVNISRENAKRAGVENSVTFKKQDVRELSHNEPYGFIITNPPYGERLKEENLPDIYKSLGEGFFGLDNWSMYLLSGYEDCEKHIGRKADKNRKIYNGMMKTYLYQYIGEKPKKERDN